MDGSDIDCQQAGLEALPPEMSSADLISPPPETAAQPAKTLTASALDATRWNYLGLLSRGATALVVGTILARLLGPKPFGQIAVAALVFGLANLIADAGFSSALVQIPQLSKQQVRVAFTMQILLGCGMTGGVWLLAPFVSALFHDPAILKVIRAVSPLFFLQALGQTAIGLMRRDMRFRALQTAQVLSYLGGYAAVGIVMAYAGYGVWSLVAAQLVQASVYSVLVYAQTRHSVRPFIDRAGLRIVRFGMQVTGANLINWTIVNFDNIVVGRTFGATYLGLYSRSFNLAITPVEGFVTACQQVLFTSCSRVEQQYDRIGRAYLAAAAGTSLIIMPVFCSLAACSPVVIAAILGARWGEAAPLFRAFAVAMPFFALMAIAGPILNAADRVDLEIRSQAISLAVTVVTFVVAAHVSLMAMAWSIPFVYAFRFVSITQPTLRLLGITWRKFFAGLAGPLLVTLITSCSVFGAARLIGTAARPILALALLAAVGVLAFTAASHLCRGRLLPTALALPLRARTAHAPAWIRQLLNPYLCSAAHL